MAEMITLRAYLSELGSLLERDSLAEVISHCRYLLQHYPQNVETYRLLAKALLQRAHDENMSDLFKESAEVFQRVLSVLPNDYVAHLGMSEIREHDGALDEAIWHLERAYEQIPGNQTLQQALRELYVKRDGEGHAPEKIQLTRAALARQYINAQLYDQALIELRTALQQNPDRVDLQVLLSETLWESQHPIEAAEVAVQILRKLPNCLPANRILARLWLDNERPTDAQVFLDRLEAVDPYTAASVVRPDSEAPDQIMIARLDYQTQAQVISASETPEWVQELGDLGGEFDMASTFQSPSGTQPPERADVGTEFGGPQGDFAGWASEPASVADEVPDWFADLGGGLEPPLSPPAPAAQPVEPGVMDWFSEPPVFDAGPSPAAEADLSSEVPDWFANVMEEKAPPPLPTAQSAVEADWLLREDEPSAPSLESPIETAPDRQPAVEAEWLLEEDTGLDETPSPSIESLLESAPEAQQAAPPEWLFAGDESEPSWSESGVPQDAETIPSEADLEEQPPSGFTGLLEEIETARSSEASFDDLAQVEPEPPAWLSGLGEVATPGEVPAAEPDISSPASTLDLSAETPSTESFGTDQFAWSDASDELQPAEELPPLVAGTAEEEAAFLASFDEPLPDLESLVLPEPESAGNWLPDLGDVTEMWEAAPGMNEIPEVPAEEMPVGAEWAASEIDELIEPASELPDWAREAAPEPESPPAVPAVGDESTVIIPPPPVVDEDMMALFETQDKLVSPAEEAALFETAEEISGIEAPKEPGLDWLEPAATEDDWLGSFSKPASEPEEVSQEPLSLDALAQPADAAGGMWWQENAQSLQPVEDAGQPEEWLATMPDLDLESVSEPPTSEPAQDLITDLEPEAFGEESELLAPAETPEPTESPERPATGFTSRLLSSLSDNPQDDEAEAPAWLVDMEPVGSPAEEEAGDLAEQSYDPFKGGSPDNVPQYVSARDTGILQPDEKPDWMTAFTGEEMPPRALEIPDLEPELEIEPEQEPDESAAAETDRLTDVLQQEAEVADEYFLDTEETIILDQNRSGEAEGTMPDWLVAITKSEADKFQDLLPPEPEPYLAEDTGVLQPGSEPDWLQQIEDKPETNEAWVDPGATDILSLDELMAGIEQSQAADTGRTEIFEPNSGDAEPLDQEIADLILEPEESEEFDSEATQLFGDDVDAQGILAGLASLREDEVAQPTDSAHTSQMESVFDQTELYEDLDDEPVPDDLSFGDWLPLWLRGTSGHHEDQAQLPDWLTDSF